MISSDSRGVLEPVRLYHPEGAPISHFRGGGTHIKHGGEAQPGVHSGVGGGKAGQSIIHNSLYNAAF